MIVLFIVVILFIVVGCFFNQVVEIMDGKIIVIDGKFEVDNDIGMVFYKNVVIGKIEQINCDQLKNMSELDN